MKPRLMFVLLTALFGLGAGVGAPSEPSSPVAVPPAPVGALSNSERHWLASAAVGDKFLIQVRLPEKYEPGKQKYPVIVVLDGDYWFGAASDVATHLPMTKEAPWAIVVGVGYGDTRDVWWKKRARDFLPKPERSEAKGKLSFAGGSERFREFLAAELLPFIEKNYPVRSDDRTLVGYSLGGFFALDTLFTKSGLFQRYVVISPAVEWDRKRIFAIEEAYHAGHDSLPAIVFHSIGGSEKNLTLWQELEQQMRARGYRDLRLVSQVFQGETHVSTVPAALGRGLKAVRLAPESDAQSAEEPPIRTQVIQAVQGMFAAEERLDAAAAWAVHADVPGYKWVDTDGTAYDFAGTQKVWTDFLAGSAKLTYTTLKEDVLVLAPDLALYTWTGSADVTPKNGPRIRNEQWTARYLCRCIGGTWKIIGGQESSAPGRPVGVPVAGSLEAVQVTRSEVHRIPSKAVGDDFVIQVRLPESYGKGQGRYPVVYVLDADVWFGVVADMADSLPFRKDAPEVIVVGISYGGSIDDWWTKRSRDLTPSPDRSQLWGEWPLAGGAAKFQDLLQTEVIPLIDSRYRTAENDRALVGLSFGGLFGAHTLFTRPALFQRYILIAPALAWDERGLWEVEAGYYEAHKNLPAVVFTAVGERDSGKKIIEPWQDFNRLIERRGYEDLVWTSHVFPDETHISVYASAVTRGLMTIYEQKPAPGGPRAPGVAPSSGTPAGKP